MYTSALFMLLTFLSICVAEPTPPGIPEPPLAIYPNVNIFLSSADYYALRPNLTVFLDAFNKLFTAGSKFASSNGSAGIAQNYSISQIRVTTPLVYLQVGGVNQTAASSASYTNGQQFSFTQMSINFLPGGANSRKGFTVSNIRAGSNDSGTLDQWYRKEFDRSDDAVRTTQVFYPDSDGKFYALRAAMLLLASKKLKGPWDSLIVYRQDFGEEKGEDAPLGIQFRNALNDSKEIIVQPTEGAVWELPKP